jgi:hypothetical protein
VVTQDAPCCRINMSFEVGVVVRNNGRSRWIVPEGMMVKFRKPRLTGSFLNPYRPQCKKIKLILQQTPHSIAHRPHPPPSHEIVSCLHSIRLWEKSFGKLQVNCLQRSRLLGHSPNQPLPTRLLPPQSIHSLLRPLQQRLPLNKPLRIRLHNLLLQHRIHDIRL